jgi:hypothetical protein
VRSLSSSAQSAWDASPRYLIDRGARNR